MKIRAALLHNNGMNTLLL